VLRFAQMRNIVRRTCLWLRGVKIGLGPSSTESLGGAGFRLGGFFFPVLRRRVRVERLEKTSRDAGDFIDRGEERGFVRLRRLVETGDFSHELKRSRSHLFVGNGRIEVEEGFDVPAHGRMTSRRGHFLMGGAWATRMAGLTPEKQTTNLSPEKQKAGRLSPAFRSEKLSIAELS